MYLLSTLTILKICMFIIQGIYSCKKKKVRNSTEGLQDLNLLICSIDINHIDSLLKSIVIN